MKKTILALSLAALSVPALAQGKKPEPEYTISGNFGVTSDYRFRGISQSDKKPAIQGGIDFAHKSGLYLGNWNSSVSDFAAPRGSGIEMDFYGGYKTEVLGIGLDLGTIYYYYPGAQTTATNFKNPVNTHEIYVGLGWGPVSFKTSYTMSDRYFGLGKDNDTSLQRNATSTAKGTLYYDISLAKEVASGLTVKAHAGFLDLNDKEAGLDYIQDFSVGVAYDMSGWIVGLNYHGVSGLSADAKTFFTTLDGRNTLLYRNGVSLSLTKAF
ncbi:MAG: TorF family putative porin [Betaproteobacteria bacterium]